MIRELASLNHLAYDYSETLMNNVAEPFEKYSVTQVKRYQDGKIQIRNRGFRRAIRKIYDDTCVLYRIRLSPKTMNR